MKNEGFYLVGTSEPFAIDESFTEFEIPKICESMQILNSSGYVIMMAVASFNARKSRLNEEYEKNSKASGPGEGQPKEGNPSLREASSQFNGSLLDDHGKKIKHLTKKISRLNKIIHKKNLKIEEFRKESSRPLRGKIKMFGENLYLEQELKDKNAVLSDVSEELRLTKIREKNLAELGLKYVWENEKLKKKLAEKIVDKIDAQALKSAESALAYKEKVIAEKDDVIADLGNELAATKNELETFKESYKRRIKEDSEHFEHIQKICNVGLQKWLIESEYLEKDKPFCFPQLPDFIEEEEKKLSSVKDTHPTEDNPEEIEIEKAVKLVRKAMKEGHTVTIDYKD